MVFLLLHTRLFVIPGALKCHTWDKKTGFVCFDGVDKYPNKSFLRISSVLCIISHCFSELCTHGAGIPDGFKLSDLLFPRILNQGMQVICLLKASSPSLDTVVESSYLSFSFPNHSRMGSGLG